MPAYSLFLRARYRVEPHHVQRDPRWDGDVALNLHGRTRHVDRGCRDGRRAPAKRTGHQVEVGIDGDIARGEYDRIQVANGGGPVGQKRGIRTPNDYSDVFGHAAEIGAVK